MFKIKNILKSTVVHLRNSFKFLLLLCVGIAIILFLICVVYRPMYSVSLNGDFLGYTADKSELQSKINEYVKSGDNDSVAFVEIENLPEYKMCLLKKGLTANDDEIFASVINTGTPYYKYYAVLDNGVEKYYVKTYEESEAIIDGLKEKGSSNIDNITYIVKYETEMSDFVDSETAIASLYTEPQKVVKKSSGKVNLIYSVKNLGLASLVQPVSGSISSRFGARSRIRSSAHTGLDIATSIGTPFVPIADGVVTLAEYKGSYGKLIIVNHGTNSSGQVIESYYAHCSSINVSVGQTVNTSTIIGKVGSTGNSTGPHLHLEIRIDGDPVNPQNYLYK